MIAQEDDFGCGVACVANLVGISYQAALRIFKEPDKAKRDGYLCREIVEALADKGATASYKYIKPHQRKEIYHTGTIIFIARSKRYPAGHYLLRIDAGWLDPWMNFPRLRRQPGIRRRLPGRPIYMIRCERSHSFNRAARV